MKIAPVNPPLRSVELIEVTLVLLHWTTYRGFVAVVLVLKLALPLPGSTLHCTRRTPVKVMHLKTVSKYSRTIFQFLVSPW